MSEQGAGGKGKAEAERLRGAALLVLIMVAVGLFLVVDNTPLPARAAGVAPAGGQAGLYWLGWGLIALGCVVLLGTNRTFWPELAVAVVLVLLVLAGYRLPALLQCEEGERIPIPSGQLEGGIEFLSPGQALSLDAVVPNASKTPEVQVSAYGRVVEARGEEAPVVLVEVMPEGADDLQAALLVEGAKVTYRLLPALPTATATPKAPAPTATAVPLPGPTDRPGQGRGYAEIAVGKIESRVSALVTAAGEGAGARLVIVEKQEEAPAGTPEAVTTTYAAHPFCVNVEAFLDEHGNKQATFDAEKTAYVLVSFEMEDLPQIARSLAAAEKIWLESEAGCE